MSRNIQNNKKNKPDKKIIPKFNQGVLFRSKNIHMAQKCNNLIVISKKSFCPPKKPFKPCISLPKCNNPTNIQYKLKVKLAQMNDINCYDEAQHIINNYNEVFTKGLEHNIYDGHLTNTNNYDQLVNSILLNNQKQLSKVPLANGSEILLSNPTASNSFVLLGPPYCSLCIDIPPSLSDPTMGSEILELYAMAVLRDIDFYNYSVDPNVDIVLDNNRINSPFILQNLKYKQIGNFNYENLFRLNLYGTLSGPYISQLLFLDTPYKILIPQKYPTLNARYSDRVEWGVSNDEIINVQNGHISILPSQSPLIGPIYINNGRTLAEFIHSDIDIRPYSNAVFILESLKCPWNTGFVNYSNQSPYVTGTTRQALQAALGEVCGLAMKHAFYWKWKKYRKVRPEVVGLWIDNVYNGRVSNIGNYDINNNVFTNDLLNDVKDINELWGFNNSVTLPLCYKEGSPVHPSYPSVHAVVAGACCTLLKIYFDASVPWISLDGINDGKLSNGVNGIIETIDGQNLISSGFNGITVEMEINKLASNIGLGRMWAGVNYRSDIVQGLLLGEQVAVKYMREILSANVEDNLDGTVPEISFRNFNGKIVVVRALLSK